MHFKKTTLKNGYRIITAPNHETKAVTVLFLVGTGARYELLEENGISHFLEHILFKGTKKYPSAQILSSTLDGIGAQFNAFTGEEYTGFYVSAEASHFSLIIDVLHDMLYAPKFSEADIKREKGVIIEEMNMYRDLPQYAVWDALKELVYGDVPLGRKIVGMEETVTKFTKKDFQNYQKTFYTPENIVVSVAGNPGKNNWEASLKKLLTGKTGKKARDFEPVFDLQAAPQVKIQSKKTDQTHLVLALPGIKATDDQEYKVRVLKTILGGGMSSRLFNEIREKRGLAYYVRASLDSMHDVGGFFVSAGVRNSAAPEAVKVILKELKKLKNKKVDAKELRKAKEMLKGDLALGLESSQEVANFLASQELYTQNLETPEEMMQKIEKVTTDDVIKMANELFDYNKLNLAAIGNAKQKDFEEVIKKAKL